MPRAFRSPMGWAVLSAVLLMLLAGMFLLTTRSGPGNGTIRRAVVAALEKSVPVTIGGALLGETEVKRRMDRHTLERLELRAVRTQTLGLHAVGYSAFSASTVQPMLGH